MCGWGIFGRWATLKSADVAPSSWGSDQFLQRVRESFAACEHALASMPFLREFAFKMRGAFLAEASTFNEEILFGATGVETKDESMQIKPDPWE